MPAKDEDKRETWSRSVEYLLATAGYAVGLGNVWRFPYLFYSSGGGAFLIPFVIMLCLCGIPLLYMEMAVGQYTQQGPIGALSKLCPLFKGAGLSTVVVSFFFTTYYNVIITWSFYYLFSSFTSVLPWSHCNNDWNSPHCYDGSNRTIGNNSTGNFTLSGPPADSISPTEDFYERRLLGKTSGIDEPGVLRWDLSLILLLCWIIVYFCIWKGPKSTGKVVYFTATFPYVVLFILLFRGVTLPGAGQGLLYFFEFRWALLLDAKVWINAAAQTFNSLGIAFGGIITMSSYNKRSNRIFKDVLIIGIVDALTCILAGLAIFSILGYLAHNQQKSIDEVVAAGPGLVFVIYPEAFNTLPLSQLFAALFFFMLICLGIDSQFASVEVIVTTIQDHFDAQVKKYLRKKEVLVGVVCFFSFLCGLPNVTQGGIYFFQLIDYYAAALSLMYLAFFEVIAITWIYGARRLADNVLDITGVPPPTLFVICWYFVSPLLIFGIWMFSMVQFKPLSIAGYEYPGWAQGIGWAIAMASVICIPAGMVHAIVKATGANIIQKLKNSLKPEADIIDDTEHPDMMHQSSKYNVQEEAFPLNTEMYSNGKV
uniref:Transporter n=1 Tax=Sinonovacula rivularis TaxID=489091 RepID=A0AA49X8G2_9BIVA|nr:INE1 [Sinonovacula rivularis]